MLCLLLKSNNRKNLYDDSFSRNINYDFWSVEKDV